MSQPLSATIHKPTPRWLSLVPRSLFGRNLLLIVALMALAEIAMGVVLRYEVQVPRISRAQDYTVQLAQETRQLLIASDAKQRQLWQQLHPAPKDIHFPWRFSLAYRLAPDYLAQLQQRLGQFYLVHWQNADDSQPKLWLAIRLQPDDEQRYWLALDPSALQTNITPLLSGFAIAAAILAVLGAALIQSRLNRPLKLLAEAASAFGRGQVDKQLPAKLQPGCLPPPREIAQLAQAMQQMAQDLCHAEQERTLLLAGVSHDIRTPLTKMRLAVEILSTSQLDDADFELLQSLVRNINAADAVIAQFTAFARNGSDEAEQEIDVCALLHEILRDTPQVMLQLPVATQTLRCRPIALQRAVQNLLDNALRYAAPQQAGDIVLSLAFNSPSELMISVADRGPGIPHAQRAFVRQPYTRLAHARAALDNAEATPDGGVGLGLAIVERIARLHHGSLQLQEREGGGLIAALHLPLLASI